jgi:hypothetical protein
MSERVVRSTHALVSQNEPPPTRVRAQLLRVWRVLGFMRWEERLIDVTFVGSGTRTIKGVRVHRARRLDEERDILRRDGMRVTSPARTLLDLAAVLSPEALRSAARRTQAEHRVNIRQLAEILGRANGHRGVPALRAIVADGPAPTRTDLEEPRSRRPNGRARRRCRIRSRRALCRRRSSP